MQALLYTDSYELEVRELDAPSPDAGDVLVQVEAAGICASDVRPPEPHDDPAANAVAPRPGKDPA